MKAKTMIATALLTAGLGFGTASTSANAATWHKGTPRALRGKWKCNLHKKSYPHWGNVKIYSNLITEQFQGDPTTYLTNVKYKAFGHYHYKLRGLAKTKSGIGHPDWESWTIKKHGSRIDIKFNAYNAGQWYSKYR